MVLNRFISVLPRFEKKIHNTSSKKLAEKLLIVLLYCSKSSHGNKLKTLLNRNNTTQYRKLCNLIMNLALFSLFFNNSRFLFIRQEIIPHSSEFLIVLFVHFLRWTQITSQIAWQRRSRDKVFMKGFVIAAMM